MGPAHTADISLRWAHRKKAANWLLLAVNGCVLTLLLCASRTHWLLDSCRFDASYSARSKAAKSATLKLQTIGRLVGTAVAEREGPSLTKVGFKRRRAVSVSSRRGRAAADIDETFKSAKREESEAKLCWTGHQPFWTWGSVVCYCQ